MPTLLGWIIVGTVIVGLFVGLYVLVVKRQADEPHKRGEDSSMPPDGGG
jgi:hypothetical protein